MKSVFVKRLIFSQNSKAELINRLGLADFSSSSGEGVHILDNSENCISCRFCEVYLYEREVSARHITEEFLRRVSAQTYGDLKSPSKLEIKYLDIFDGMMNIPDAIIHFGEA